MLAETVENTKDHRHLLSVVLVAGVKFDEGIETDNIGKSLVKDAVQPFTPFVSIKLEFGITRVNSQVLFDERLLSEGHGGHHRGEPFPEKWCSNFLLQKENLEGSRYCKGYRGAPMRLAVGTKERSSGRKVSHDRLKDEALVGLWGTTDDHNAPFWEQAIFDVEFTGREIRAQEFGKRKKLTHVHPINAPLERAEREGVILLGPALYPKVLELDLSTTVRGKQEGLGLVG